MVEGQSLHYYNPYVPNEIPDQYSYFRRFDQHWKGEMSEEMLEVLQPSSPNSIQSDDSENSLSSIEIPQKELRLSNQVIKANQLTEVQCRWRSCGILFPSLDQLASHVSKVHSASGLGGLFYCGWEGCTRDNKGFNARYKMLVHVRTHTNEKPHKCFQCHKSFSRAENLKIHSRSHSGEKPYVCPVSGCNKAYSNSSDRFKHTRTHQVDKPYQCKIPGCSKRYTDPSSLRKHVKTYKHFPNENQKNEHIKISESGIPSANNVEERLSSDEPMFRENVIRHPCKCNKVCCVTKCVTSRSDLFKIGNLINPKATERSTWDKYVDPFVIEQNNLYTRPYEESMHVDGPLDLSLHRK